MLLHSYPNFYSVSAHGINTVSGINRLTAEQFSKYANLFFLFTAFIQQIPGVSPTNRYTTIAPLAVVLLASAFKEVQEDLVRTFSFPHRPNLNLIPETTPIGRRAKRTKSKGLDTPANVRREEVEGHQSGRRGSSRE